MKIKNSKLWLAIAGVCLIATLIYSNKNSENKIKKIGITQIIEHDCLDKSREGFVEGLLEYGFKDGENIKIDYQNAGGDQSICNQIANNFVQGKKDLILAISTPSAQAVSNLTSEIPTLITAVTDPKSCGLTKQNIAGTSDMVPPEKQINLIKKLLPNAKNIGILYSSNEVNSQYQANAAAKEAEKLGLKTKDYTVSNSNELRQVLEYMANAVDVVFVPTDNLVVSCMPLVSKYTNENKIPIICSETASVKNGALATYGIDYYELGKLTAKQAAEILNGKKVEDMEIECLNDTKLTLNGEVAKKLGIEISTDLLKTAEIIGE